MGLRIKENSIAFNILMMLGAAEDLTATLLMPPHKWRLLERYPDYNTYRTTVYRLIKTGLIEIVKDGVEKTYKLTKEGEMQVFLTKTKLPYQGPWDGKWRFIIFDIPEESKDERDKLRKLLLENGFKMMQASVYVSPYALNREAVQYLKDTGLNQFIRIIRADDVDDDFDLKRKFKIK
jgi:phenylacetic acid degradation operon negative regulatory protein